MTQKDRRTSIQPAWRRGFPCAAKTMKSNANSEFNLVLALGLGLVWGCSGTVGRDGTEATVEPSSEAGDPRSGAGPASTTAGEQNDSAPSPDSSGAPSSTTDEPGSGDDDPATPVPEDNPALAPSEFECDANLRAPDAPLRRLSHKQYTNTVRDLVVRAFGAPELSDEDSSALTDLLGEVPEDERLKLAQDLHGSYRRLDQRVQQPHVDSWYESGVEVGKWMTVPQRLSQLLGGCSDLGDACVDEFIARFGRLALRRSLTSDDIAFYRGFYAPSTGIDGAGFADVVAGFLNAPEFLYLVEGRGESAAADSGVSALTPHELAARLSYHFWNTMPDPELSELADSGGLADPDVYRAQVERLFADPRTMETVREFYNEWLKLEDVPRLDRNNESALFRAFAGTNLPSGELAPAMQAEALSLLDYFTFQQPGNVREVLSTPYVFPATPELAGIYGVDVWDGQSTPPMVEQGRPGLLTRGAFLVTGTANTRPIMRGLFIRTALLCDTIAPPPAAAGATPPELSPDLTTREVVEQLTEPSACFGCHDTFLNPLGFALEGFDSLGRARTEQQLFDEQGVALGAKAIDASSVPQVILGDRTASSGAESLMDMMSTSGKVEACLSRQYFRFTFGRWEGVSSDGCALEEMRSVLASGGSLADLLREVALGSGFRTRTIDTSAGAPEAELP